MEATLANDESYTIKEFCEAEKLSRAMLYRLWSEGKGPRWFCSARTNESLMKPELSGAGS
jgi:hypothetical protein